MQKITPLIMAQVIFLYASYEQFLLGAANRSPDSVGVFYD